MGTAQGESEGKGFCWNPAIRNQTPVVVSSATNFAIDSANFVDFGGLHLHLAKSELERGRGVTGEPDEVAHRGWDSTWLPASSENFLLPLQPPREPLGEGVLVRNRAIQGRLPLMRPAPLIQVDKIHPC